MIANGHMVANGHGVVSYHPEYITGMVDGLDVLLRLYSTTRTGNCTNESWTTSWHVFKDKLHLLFMTRDRGFHFISFDLHTRAPGEDRVRVESEIEKICTHAWKLNMEFECNFLMPTVFLHISHQEKNCQEWFTH